LKTRSYQIHHYFAYGSNMNPERMKARGIGFNTLFAGKLFGFQLRFNKQASGKEGVAYANIGFSPVSHVEGVLYELNHPDDISMMDRFEGNPYRYGRDVFQLSSAKGVISAWVYVANKALLKDGLLPEKRYMDHLLGGKEWHSDSYYQWLVDQPSIDNSKEKLPSSVDGLIYNG
jgi:gamma-glutamylcyclotransferase (GGCT)/AIG2-like uncharacterized protein YtfP